MKNTAKNQRILIKLCPKYAYVINDDGVHKVLRTEWESFKAKGMSDKEAALKVIAKPRKHQKRKTIIVNI